MTRPTRRLGFLLPAAALWAFAPAARADVLELADGRTVEGRVVKDGEVYRVTSRFGEAEVAVKDVKTWVKAKAVEVEWRERLDRLAPDDHAGRAALAKWLAESGRPDEANATALAVLEADPENAVAHAVLGHVRHKGEWMTPDDAKRADGLEEHGGTWYTAEEWKLVGPEGQKKAAEADAALHAKRVAERVNEYLRWMLSPDRALRQRGKSRLEAMAKEQALPNLPKLIAQVEAYAAAGDRLAAAYDAGGGGGDSSSSVLAECRIQFAKLKRPITQLSTSLGSSVGGAPVTIQLPELEVIKVDTTVRIPAGG
jgi:hypothetical protein